MSILSMLLNVAVTATHRGGVRPRTITISKDGIRRELRLYDVVAIAAKVAGVAVPQFRDATACCRVLRAAAATIRKHQREQKKRWLDSPFTSLDGVNVLDLRRATWLASIGRTFVDLSWAPKPRKPARRLPRCSARPITTSFWWIIRKTLRPSVSIWPAVV